MWARYNEPLSLAELADEAILSRFYFSRLFRTVTGTSPGRFLAAVRLHRAKNLLLETSVTVTEISYQVGYNSLGTFTSRFTRSVGMSPVRYRTLSRDGAPPLEILRPREPHRRRTVIGRVLMPPTDATVRVYVGAFVSVIAEGAPASCDVVDGPGAYRLSALPNGDWFVHAVAVARSGLDPCPWRRRPLFVGRQQRVRMTGEPRTVDLVLRPFRSTDIPILLALPELDCMELPQLVPTLSRP